MVQQKDKEQKKVSKRTGTRKESFAGSNKSNNIRKKRRRTNTLFEV